MAGGPPESQDDSPALLASINVTPFVDVVLVLLVIFMVTAPILAKDILKLNLPKTESGDGKVLSTLGIAINRDGQILLNGLPVTPETLRAEVTRALAENPETQAIVAADQTTEYGNVVRAIDLIKGAGLNRFAIQIERSARP